MTGPTSTNGAEQQNSKSVPTSTNGEQHQKSVFPDGHGWRVELLVHELYLQSHCTISFGQLILESQQSIMIRLSSSGKCQHDALSLAFRRSLTPIVITKETPIAIVTIIEFVQSSSAFRDEPVRCSLSLCMHTKPGCTLADHTAYAHGPHRSPANPLTVHHHHRHQHQSATTAIDDHPWNGIAMQCRLQWVDLCGMKCVDPSTGIRCVAAHAFIECSGSEQ